jgi:hypothetical protein
MPVLFYSRITAVKKNPLIYPEKTGHRPLGSTGNPVAVRRWIAVCR